MLLLSQGGRRGGEEEPALLIAEHFSRKEVQGNNTRVAAGMKEEGERRVNERYDFGLGPIFLPLLSRSEWVIYGHRKGG